MASGQPPGTDPLQPWTKDGKTSSQPQQQALHDINRGNEANSGQAPFVNQVLTEDERRVLKECENESFYKRALPLGLGAMIGAQMLVKSGRWAPNPKYGALPKALVCGGIGYFIGKVAYLPHCQEKILTQIPNSELAAQIRKQKGFREPETQSSENWESVSRPRSKLRDEYSSANQSPDLDDRFRPSVDRDVKLPEEAEEPKPGITYEELRRRNRQEYEDSSKKSPQSRSSPSYKDSVLMPKKPWPENEGKMTSEPSPTPPPVDPPQRRKRTNIWGDPIDD